ncbi:hypothetical protein [Phascolarctobacterium faecium]|uniref:hypothetical protein n=1 Tax=Phascolarctobacterium faecium TaxID=33025 RepID=UPI003AB5BE78
MGSSNKLLLAAKVTGGAIGQWQGDISCPLFSSTATTVSYCCDPAAGIGTLSPLLETVKPDIRILGLVITVNPTTMMLTSALLFFDTNPPSGGTVGIKFEKLNKIILHSTTGGEPYVIDNPQDYWAPSAYNIFSDDLANWAYTNLTAGATLDFTFELEWYE